MESKLPRIRFYPQMSDNGREQIEDDFIHPLSVEAPADTRTVEEIVKAAIRPATVFVCCGSGCAGCPEYWGT